MCTRPALRFAVLGLALGTMACGSSPSSPTASLTGTWQGTQTRGGVAGAVTLQMTQTGAGVAGTWSAVIDGVGPPQTGSLGGTVVGSVISLSMTPSAPLVCSPSIMLSGTLSMTGTVADNHLTGDYVVFLCDGAATGRIDVTRQ